MNDTNPIDKYVEVENAISSYQETVKSRTGGAEATHRMANAYWLKGRLLEAQKLSCQDSYSQSLGHFKNLLAKDPKNLICVVALPL